MLIEEAFVKSKLWPLMSVRVTVHLSGGGEHGWLPPFDIHPKVYFPSGTVKWRGMGVRWDPIWELRHFHTLSRRYKLRVPWVPRYSESSGSVPRQLPGAHWRLSHAPWERVTLLSKARLGRRVLSMLSLLVCEVYFSHVGKQAFVSSHLGFNPHNVST